MLHHKLVLVLLLISFVAKPAEGNHILGGEISMQAKSTLGNFEIKLIQFWVKRNLTIPTQFTSGNRDASVQLYIYSKATKNLMDEVKVEFKSMENIEYKNQACVTSKSMETVMGIYTGNIYLDPNKYNESDGYFISWERCCRNEDISNIKTPGQNGMVFYLEFPPVSTVNSSPEFLQPNGEYICANTDFKMSMAVTDKDGDELRFSLETPLKGYTTPTATIGDKTSKPNGYAPIVWENGYSKEEAIRGNKALAIDSKNGMLSVNASELGLYVFTVECREFRNGKQIGLVRRDFQLLVIDCVDDTPVPPTIMVAESKIDTLKICPLSPVSITTESSNEWAFQWQRNGVNITNATQPSLMVSDTGTYVVIKSFANKCTRDTTSEPIRVEYRDPILVDLHSDKEVFCKEDSLIIFGDNLTNSTERTNAWYINEAIITGQTDYKIVVTKPGSYQLKSTDILSGCFGMGSFHVTQDSMEVKMPEQFNVYSGKPITISPEIQDPSSIESFSWTASNQLVETTSLDLEITPLVDTTYILNIKSVNGCDYKYTVKINILNIIQIPDVFTPNNDGINDYFEIKNGVSQIRQVQIFNRWGLLVFYSDGYPIAWDGKYKNEMLENGYYPYVIQLDKSVLKGKILILR